MSSLTAAAAVSLMMTGAALTVMATAMMTPTAAAAAAAVVVAAWEMQRDLLSTSAATHVPVPVVSVCVRYSAYVCLYDGQTHRTSTTAAVSVAVAAAQTPAQEQGAAQHLLRGARRGHLHPPQQ